MPFPPLTSLGHRISFGSSVKENPISAVVSQTVATLSSDCCFPVQVEAQLGSGVRSRGRQFSCGRVWAKRDEKNAKG
jgi:hypothetical protein